MNNQYDYLIIGAGIFGAVSAYELTKKGYKCLVIEKRSHIAGNCFTENIEGINVHKYGAHIFHTNDKTIWDYVNQFAEFNRYTNSPIANYKGEIYNLPFNMNTFHQLWNVKTPDEAKAIIAQQAKEFGVENPSNLEEQAISLVGFDIYNKLIKEYTEKQWGTEATNLPAFIIKRLPVRFTYDNNYFNDKYQGIPIGGYTALVEKMLEGIEVKLNTDYFSDKEKGIELMTDLFKTKGNFFKQQLSNKIFDELLILLEKGDVYDFTEIMIKDYYDKRYREKKKIPISEINSDDMETASDELIELYKKKYIF